MFDRSWRILLGLGPKEKKGPHFFTIFWPPQFNFDKYNPVHNTCISEK